ncbi:MAG: carbohydrate ABC transporter permease [Alphaproteobacteria bacterium]|nr:carbohydrate ABC transporter permease [Alphaproteobacteria bacterium]
MRGRGGGLRFIGALALLVVFLFPLFWILTVAFKNPEDIFVTPPVWLPSTLNFQDFALIFSEGYYRAILNSLIVATGATIIAMVFGTTAAYSIARHRTGGETLANWILSWRMLPPIAVVFPIFLVFSVVELRDSYFGLILLNGAFNIPYVVWMMRGYIEDVPIELEESALVDGCSRWQTLYRVVLPMARTGLFATAVFTFIFAWNEYAFALVLTETEVITVPVQIAKFMGREATYFSRIAALSLLALIPVFLAVVTMQRYLVRGISLGAIKG